MPALLLSTAIVCASLLVPITADRREEYGRWVLACAADACGVGTAISAKDDPNHTWLKVLFSRENDAVRMDILTPPLTEARLKATLGDEEIVNHLEGTCDLEKCLFGEDLNDKRVRDLTGAGQLHVEVRTRHDMMLTAFDVDLRGLADAIARLPRDL